MTEHGGDVLIEADFRGNKVFIIDRDYWHLTHRTGILSHNVRNAQGFIWSISAVNHMENTQDTITMYGAQSRFSDKEAAWEDIRKTEFPSLPTRINALFLFNSRELAETAAANWFGKEDRLLVRTQLVYKPLTFHADAKWLDGVTSDSLQDRARKYWSGEMTDSPMPEIIVCGLAFFPEWWDWSGMWLGLRQKP